MKTTMMFCCAAWIGWMACFELAAEDSNGRKAPRAASPPNQLTEAEKAEGWHLLFDGQTTSGWRSFKKPGFPEKGWVVEDGWLKLLPKGGGGDIMTKQTFSDFELQWEWRLPPKANNGVKYFITESRSGAIGHEYQMIDNTTAKAAKHQTASFYDVLPPSKPTPLKPMGEINHSRIVVLGDKVEHWLNGQKVLEYNLGSPELMQAVAQSKFKNVDGFGTKIRGHILLTDHHDQAEFRNIKIRALR